MLSLFMELFRKQHKNILIVLLLLIVVFLFNGMFVVNKETNFYKDKYKLESQKYSEEKNKNGELVLYQEMVEAQNSRLIDSLAKTIDFGKNISKPKIYIQEKIKVQIDSLYIAYKDSTDEYKSFQDSTQFYFIAGKAYKSGVKFSKISFPITTTFLISTKPAGIFKTKTVVNVHHNSPYVVSQDLKSVYTKEEIKPIYKTGTKILIFALGVFIGHKL